MEGEQPEQAPVIAEKPRRRMSRKKQQITAIAIVVIVIAILVAFWGTQPQPAYSPTDLLNSPEQYKGKTVQVRGLAKSVDEVNKTFVLTDFNVNLTVRYSSLPQGFQIEIEMIVKGTLEGSGNAWVFVAQDVLVGHPK